MQFCSHSSCPMAGIPDSLFIKWTLTGERGQTLPSISLTDTCESVMSCHDHFLSHLLTFCPDYLFFRIQILHHTLDLCLCHMNSLHPLDSPHRFRWKWNPPLSSFFSHVTSLTCNSQFLVLLTHNSNLLTPDSFAFHNVDPKNDQLSMEISPSPHCLPSCSSSWVLGEEFIRLTVSFYSRQRDSFHLPYINPQFFFNCRSSFHSSITFASPLVENWQSLTYFHNFAMSIFILIMCEGYNVSPHTKSHVFHPRWSDIIWRREWYKFPTRCLTSKWRIREIGISLPLIT